MRAINAVWRRSKVRCGWGVVGLAVGFLAVESAHPVASLGSSPPSASSASMTIQPSRIATGEVVVDDPFDGSDPVTPGALPVRDSSSTAKLTVYTRPDLGCGMIHRDDVTLSFFASYVQDQSTPDLTEAGCGTFIAVESSGQSASSVFGPAIVAGFLYDGHRPPTAFTPVAQTPVTGSGSVSDPYRVTTVASAGATGVVVTQVDTWDIQSETVNTTITAQNTSAAPLDVVVYRAGDCQEGSFTAFGYTDIGQAACVPVAFDGADRKIARFVPGNQIVRMSSSDPFVGTIIDNSGGTVIGRTLASGAPFVRGMCVVCDRDRPGDHSLGLSWKRAVPARGSVTVDTATTLSMGPARMFTRLTASLDPTTSDVMIAELSIPDLGSPREPTAPPVFGTPSVAGRQIRMLRDGTEVCRAQTDRNGRARCSIVQLIDDKDPAAAQLSPSPTVDVMFDGDVLVQPATLNVRVAPDSVLETDLPVPAGCLPKPPQYGLVASGSVPGSMYLAVPHADAGCSTVRHAMLGLNGEVIAYVPGGGLVASQLSFGSQGGLSLELVTARFRQPETILAVDPVSAVSPGKARS